MYLCEKNKVDIVKILIEAFKININQKNNYVGTGFMYAWDNDSLEVIKLLLEKYPDVINQKNNNEWTGFMYLC